MSTSQFSRFFLIKLFICLGIARIYTMFLILLGLATPFLKNRSTENNFFFEIIFFFWLYNEIRSSFNLLPQKKSKKNFNFVQNRIFSFFFIKNASTQKRLKKLGFFFLHIVPYANWNKSQGLLFLFCSFLKKKNFL